MKKTLLSVVAGLSFVLAAALGFVFLRAYRNGITIRMGDSAGTAMPPPPAGLVRGGPPDGGLQSPTYTNDQLHALLQRESSQLGIQGIVTRGEREEEPSAGFLGPRLGSPETRAQAEAAIRQLVRMRRGVETDKKPTVPLAGRIVPLLAEPETGGGAVEPAQNPPTQEPPEATAQSSAPEYWSGLYGGTQLGTLTISDARTWAQTWSGISRDPLPAVDFSRRQVAAVFLGLRTTGGFRVDIEPAVTVLPTAVVVRYREISPIAGRTPPEGATAPYALRAIARSALPVRFERLP